MRCANRAVKRSRFVQPTLDDIQSKLNGSVLYSKLDLNSGYHQLILNEGSRYLTTFSTHIGLFRYKRLNFGISSASEIFQNVISQVVDGIDGVMNISDDIIVSGKSQAEHDNSLKKVFAKANGMEPSPDKVKSVQDMDIPKNKEEVQSFLGLVNYSSRFIRNFSTLSEPLRRLTHKGQDFVWGENQSKAFDSLKQALSSKPVIKYFDVNKESELLVDASPFGLGAILIQYDRDGTAEAVAYGSRALAPTENKYAQIEREALAVVWACEHFNLYIFGKPITVATDNKPLVSLLGSPTAKLPMRLERWM